MIIPAYNEAKRLPLTLVDVDKKLPEMDFDYEIIVVDDGSTDETAEIAEKFKPLIKNLRIVNYGGNRGKGYAVKYGMLQAKGEVRLFMDADNSTTVDQFARMQLYFAEGASVVIGSRSIRGAKLNPPQPLHKRIMGKLGNLFIQALAVPGIWDTQCGFKALSAAAAEDIFRRTRIERWAFDVEMLALARKLGYEIKEVPVIWINDTRSHVKLTSYFKVLLDTVKVGWRIRRGYYDRETADENSAEGVTEENEG